MASGEKPSWGGNFLEKFKRSPLARVIGAVAVVASAAGLAADAKALLLAEARVRDLSIMLLNNQRLAARRTAG